MLESKPPLKNLRVLLVDDSPGRRAAIEQALTEVGCDVIGFASSTDNLLYRVEADDPEVVIIDMDSPGRDVLEGLESVQSSAPRPIVMFTQDDDGRTITRATRAGVSAYVVDGISQKRVRPILDAAIERFQQFRLLADELEKTRAEIQQRKMLDKAKGILMQRRGMSEDEAYKAMDQVRKEYGLPALPDNTGGLFNDLKARMKGFRDECGDRGIGL